jgi:predicted GIY-YIG superfamily endonuclease
MYFVYKLSHPISGDIGYVGVTNNLYKRFKEHIAANGDMTKKGEWVKSLRSENLIPSISVIEAIETEEQAYMRERYWIQHFIETGVDLYNMLLLEDAFLNAPKQPRKKYVSVPGVLDAGSTMTKLGIKSRKTLYKLIKDGVIHPIPKPDYILRRVRLEFTEQEVNRVLRGEPIQGAA